MTHLQVVIDRIQQNKVNQSNRTAGQTILRYLEVFLQKIKLLYQYTETANDIVQYIFNSKKFYVTLQDSTTFVEFSVPYCTFL